MRKFWCVCLATLVAAAWAGTARADVKLADVFGSNMVLQREMKVPVWGTAAAGEKVTVSFAGQTATATAAADGQWKVTLKPLGASAQGREMTVKGKNTLTLANVLVGEVWVCSGQSNMEMGIGNCNLPGEVAKADDPGLRLLIVPHAASDQPQKNFGKTPSGPARSGEWKVCTPGTVMEGGWNGFSAAGYFFGREIRQKLGVPVGLIGAYWRGTPAQTWTSRKALLAVAEFRDLYLRDWANRVAAYPRQLAAYQAGPAANRNQPQPEDPANSLDAPAHLYNGMIAPLIPYAIRGAIWYQGESNAVGPEASRYQRLFSAMIADWRAQWGQGGFPFLYVQLANYIANRYQDPNQPGESDWATLRESQLRALALPKTAMVVTIDVGNPTDIHPKDKLSVGRRLALAALKVAYGKADAVCSGPVFDKMRIRGGEATLTFKQLGGGLVARPEGPLKGFAIAGADKKFVWANAVIDGDTVVVSSPQVKFPVAVRYAWADNPVASLFNKAGLPASPFRTEK